MKLWSLKNHKKSNEKNETDKNKKEDGSFQSNDISFAIYLIDIMSGTSFDVPQPIDLNSLYISKSIEIALTISLYTIQNSIL